MYNRLISFLECGNVLSNSQFGFQKGKGISNAILSFTESVLNARDNRNQTMGLFLDLSKAFDTVDHDILIKKLEQFGIRGLAKDWFISYLRDRKQIVEVYSAKSNLSTIKQGVPQGSILGSVLFLLYINDLPSNLPLTKTVLFADDTNILFNDANTNNLQRKINETSLQLEHWLGNNKLKLNVNNTVCTNFNHKQLHDPITILLNNSIIKEVNCTKFLGIWVDSDLTWKNHIQYLTHKLSRLCYAFRVLIKITPIEVLNCLFWLRSFSIIMA